MNDIKNPSDAINAISTALNSLDLDSLDHIEEVIVGDYHLFDFHDTALLNLIKTTRTAIAIFPEGCGKLPTETETKNKKGK